MYKAEHKTYPHKESDFPGGSLETIGYLPFITLKTPFSFSWKDGEDFAARSLEVCKSLDFHQHFHGEQVRERVTVWVRE